MQSPDAETQIASLQADRIAALEAELAEARGQQAATAGVLKVISGSPTDMRRALEQISETAACLCEADYSAFFRLRDGRYHVGASNRMGSPFIDILVSNPMEPGRNTCVGRAALERRVIHVADALADRELTTPENMERQRVSGIRTVLGVPIISAGQPVAVIFLARTVVKTFSDQQIALVQVLGEQALIAIENARLFEAEQARTRELAESLEHQTATREVLGIMSRSMTDLRSIFEHIVKTTQRLCDAYDVAIALREDDKLTLRAHEGPIPMRPEWPVLRRTFVAPRAVLDKTTIHVHDLASAGEEYPDGQKDAQNLGHRTILAVPLVHNNRGVGAIIARRFEVRPFSRRQIALVESFADHAVIAIDNARLFDAEQERSRELQESLDYRTAISDVLTSIGQSPRDLSPALQAIARNSVRLCNAVHCLVGLYDGRVIKIAAQHNNSESTLDVANRLYPMPPSRGQVSGRVILSGQVEAVEDVLRDPEYSPNVANAGGWRSILGVPLNSEGKPIGVITVMRALPGPFSAKQVNLLKTFAEQAVIAINNVKLFEAEQERTRELQESLEYQTATGEVLDIIARSRGEPQTVLRAICKAAARLCEADRVSAFRLRDGDLSWVGGSYDDQHLIEYFQNNPTPADRKSIVGRATVGQTTVHVLDAQLDADLTYAARNPGSPRTMLGVPLVSHGEVLGALGLARLTCRPFAEKQIALVELFADQAVIAIENARLLDQLQTRQTELEARSSELSQSLEYQTAISDVLNVISRSRADLAPVLQSVVETAVRLCRADHAMIYRLCDGLYRFAAGHGPYNPDYLEIERNELIPATGETLVGRVALARAAVRIDDALADPGYGKKADARVGRIRSMLGVPLLRDGQTIGVIGLVRNRVAPFNDQQAALVATFADQAVIAIENARLLDELQTRQKELEVRSAELARSVDEQRSLVEVGRAVSSSLDMEEVLQTILENACRMASAQGGAVYVYDEAAREFHLQAGYRTSAEHMELARAHPIRTGDPVIGKLHELREAVQFEDLARLEQPVTPLLDILLRAGVRAILAVPLLHQGKLIGALAIRRSQPGRFAPETMHLLEAFAAQSAIAINNARLFRELEERRGELAAALEQQTASAEVLEAISRSPDQLMPVLQFIAETSARICETPLVSVYLKDGHAFRLLVTYGLASSYEEIEKTQAIRPGKDTLVGRVALSRRPEHVHDMEADVEYQPKADARVGGIRTMLGVPLLRAGEVIGVICLARSEVQPFTGRQMSLVTTFASQAVIAINNAGLFEEVQARTRELQESLEFQTAANELLRIISRSVFDLMPVLQVALDTAVRLCKADMGSIFQLDGDVYRWRVGTGLVGAYEEHERQNRITVDRATLVGRAALAREAVHVHDAWTDPEYGEKQEARIGNVRTMLGVPLLRDGQPIGVFALARARLEPFTAREIALVTTFADQSVIAIENVRLFNEIRQKSHELELASQHKSQFLANMSHELRTPLNAILGYTELMQDGIYGLLPEKAGGVLARVQHNGKHLLGLINQVLDLSKIEAGQFRLNLSEYGLGSVIEAVVASTESLATEKRLALRAEVAPEMPLGYGDEQRIVQVLLNLVGNAIKFTERGEVRILAGSFAGRFEIAVADTGAGIPAEEIDRIFDEFHQVDSSNTKAKAGTGLGLAIARRIVEMHGGRISVVSEVGRGSTFKVELPVRVAARDEMAEANA